SIRYYIFAMTKASRLSALLLALLFAAAAVPVFAQGAQDSPAVARSNSPAQVLRTDPAIDAIVPRDAVIEKLAGGFRFTEGPIWVPKTKGNKGYLLFSDPYKNVIYRWTQDGALSVFMANSGYSGTDIGEYSQPGSNGLTLDRQGRLTIDQQGNRRVVRMEKDGKLT